MGASTGATTGAAGAEGVTGAFDGCVALGGSI